MNLDLDLPMRKWSSDAGEERGNSVEPQTDEPAEVKTSPFTRAFARMTSVFGTSNEGEGVNRKKMFLYVFLAGVAVVVGWAGLTFWDDEQSDSTETAATDPEGQLAAKSLGGKPLSSTSAAGSKVGTSDADDADGEEQPDEASDESVEADEGDETSNSASPVAGPESQDPVLEALEKIASWAKTEGGYPSSTLSQYLAHRKLWVRLAALEFALEAKALGHEALKGVALDIRQKHSLSQIRRFLERSRRSNLALHQSMLALMQL